MESAKERMNPQTSTDEKAELGNNAISEDTSAPETGGIRKFFRAVGCWFDNSGMEYSVDETADKYAVDWARLIPYAGMHLMCLGVIWVGWSWIACGIAAGLYVVHMFSITAFYHRLFSHCAYKTSRVAQFIFAVVGNSSVQRGPIWWAARHRHHHRNSDQENDVHSPVQHGLFWSHMGWITSKGAFGFEEKSVPDLMKFPELRFLDRYDNLVPLLEGVGLFFLGVYLQNQGWNTSGGQMLIWAFFVSTIVCSHATFTINSLTHVFGKKRYKSKDESRNNWWLAIITFGEGWHNNHHYYPGSVRQGFYWWEYDFTYYVLWCMSKVGIIWDLNGVPEHIREAHHIDAKVKKAA